MKRGTVSTVTEEALQRRRRSRESSEERAIRREWTAECDAAFARLLEPDTFEAIWQRRLAARRRRIAEIASGRDRVRFEGARLVLPGCGSSGSRGANALQAEYIREGYIL